MGKKEATSKPDTKPSSPSPNQETELWIEYVPLTTLQRWPRNPKEHDLGLLHGSFGRHGFVEPIIVDENSGRIVAGHGRLDTLQQLKASGKEPPRKVKAKDGEWLVPIVRGNRWENPEDAESYLITSNRSVELGGWNVPVQIQVLSDLAAKNLLEATGYDKNDVDFMIRSNSPDAQSGKLPTDIYDTYAGGTIKQIVLYFDAKQYEDVIARTDKLMAEEGVDNRTDLFLAMLKQYEDNRKDET